MKFLLLFLTCCSLLACSNEPQPQEQKPAQISVNEINQNKKETAIQQEKQNIPPAFSPNIVFDLYGFFYSKQETKSALRLTEDYTYKISIPSAKNATPFVSAGTWTIDETKGQVYLEDSKTKAVYVFQLSKDLVLTSIATSGEMQQLVLVKGDGKRQIDTSKMLQPVPATSGLVKTK
jgi:hypothetical protein